MFIISFFIILLTFTDNASKDNARILIQVFIKIYTCIREFTNYLVTVLYTILHHRYMTYLFCISVIWRCYHWYWSVGICGKKQVLPERHLHCVRCGLRSIDYLPHHRKHHLHLGLRRMYRGPQGKCLSP